MLKRESRSLLGEKRDYLTIKILHNEMTVMVPCENAHRAGLRRVIDEEQVKKVIDVLEGLEAGVNRFFYCVRNSCLLTFGRPPEGGRQLCR